MKFVKNIFILTIISFMFRGITADAADFTYGFNPVIVPGWFGDYETPIMNKRYQTVQKLETITAKKTIKVELGGKINSIKFEKQSELIISEGDTGIEEFENSTTLAEYKLAFFRNSPFSTKYWGFWIYDTI